MPITVYLKNTYKNESELSEIWMKKGEKVRDKPFSTKISLDSLPKKKKKSK